MTFLATIVAPHTKAHPIVPTPGIAQIADFNTVPPAPIRIYCAIQLGRNRAHSLY